jgi:ABC-type transport system involved in cytochrome bd biosynthesis fused ATPase/permease subunit
MHKGQLVEEGTHAELMEKRGIYYRLYLLQYKGQEEVVVLERGTDPPEGPRG